MTDQALNAIVGESAAIVRLREVIRTIGPTRLPVFIEGPTGSGKELVAAAIHEQSGRRGSFVPFNVCAIADAVFEDALFGHVRGAFTGAVNDSQGFLREAHTGTAFFDEVSGLQPHLQTKLLRAIETGRFRPVGARSDAQSDFRVVAATNEPIESLVMQGRLRADLAHRLRGMVVTIPRLIDRPEDIPLLVHHFLQLSGVVGRLSDDAIDTLQNHTWPGNVRELRYIVECAAALGGLNASIAAALLSDRRSEGAAELVSRRSRLKASLAANRGDAEATAREFGVHRATIYRWMKETQIDVQAG